MKKHGFTLAELLITLGIIGVAAALMAPAVSSFMPDKNKMIVMKVHNRILAATESMLENPELYYSGKTEGGKPNCFGLGCTQAPLADDYASYTGSSKYPQILANMLHIGKTDFITAEDGSVTFVPLKGTTCTVSSVKNNNGSLVTTLTVNVGNDSHCTFGATGCKIPNQFNFKMDTYGNMAGADKLAIAYMKNPTKYNDKKTDLALAKNIQSIPDYDTLMANLGTGASWEDELAKVIEEDVEEPVTPEPEPEPKR